MAISRTDALVVLAKHAANGELPDDFDLQTAKDVCNAAGVEGAAVLQKFLARQAELTAQAETSASGSNVEWREIDPATLTPELRKMHDEFRAANKTAAEKRDTFTKAFLKGAKNVQGTRIAFNYRWGKIQVARVSDDGKGSGGSKGKVAISDI